MRIPTYLSPSAIAKWEESIDGFYLYYMSNNRPPREPQTQPMSIGSAFDAYCKSYLHEKLFGRGHTDSNRFELKAIFEAQVEEQHRTWAWKHGEYAFRLYRESGALTDLLSDLHAAQGSPRFEFEVTGQVNGYREGVSETIDGVTLLGKPDASYINRDGHHILLDWKVNGYCSKWPTSPAKGYTRLRGAKGQSWGCHKDCSPFELGGMTININGFLEHVKTDWARQLAIYAWLCGAAIGSDFIVAIDQLSCKPDSFATEFPTVRVAEHRMRISKEYQWRVFQRAQEIWDIVHSDHIFRALTLEESKGRCSLLDQQAEALYGNLSDEEDRHFLDMTRR